MNIDDSIYFDVDRSVGDKVVKAIYVRVGSNIDVEVVIADIKGV